MYEYYLRNKEKINLILYMLAFVFIVYIFFKYVFSYVAPFVIAYIISLVLIPIANFLETKLKFKKGFSAILCCIFFIFIVVFLSKTVISKVIIEARLFLIDFPYYASELNQKLNELKTNFHYIFQLIPQGIQNNINNTLETGVSKIVDTVIKKGSLGAVAHVPYIFINSIVCVVAMFFLIKDRKVISQFFVKNMPKKAVKLFSLVKKGCFKGLITYFRAQMILMTITCAIAVIGLSINNYSYALFFGLLIGVVDALPILGSGFILWPWSAICFLNANYNRAITLLIIYAAIIIARNSLEPKLISTQIGVHPLVMLISLYAGLKLLGFIGIILGPTVVIISKILSEELVPKTKNGSVI